MMPEMMPETMQASGPEAAQVDSCSSVGSTGQQMHIMNGMQEGGTDEAVCGAAI